MVVGIYSWGKKPLGYAACRCLHCDRRTIAHAHRSFLILHLYYIPLLPLGIRKVWTCEECGESPYRKPESREAFWASFPCLLVAVLLATVCFSEPRGENAGMLWIFLAIAGGGWVHFVRKWHRIRRARKEAIARIEETDSESCLKCENPLRIGLPTTCHGCKLTVYSTHKVK